VSTSETATAAAPKGCLKAGHLAATRWVALAHLSADGLDSWQDVGVRPEGSDARFTVEIVTNEVLEDDFESGTGPHPRHKLPAGADAALDVQRMAVYLARPFTPAEALAYTEALLVEAGVPLLSLEEVGRAAFYPGA
jgi:hypothetical protein